MNITTIINRELKKERKLNKNSKVKKIILGLGDLWTEFYKNESENYTEGDELYNKENIAEIVLDGKVYEVNSMSGVGVKIEYHKNKSL